MDPGKGNVTTSSNAGSTKRHRNPEQPGPIFASISKLSTKREATKTGRDQCLTILNFWIQPCLKQALVLAFPIKLINQ